MLTNTSALYLKTLIFGAPSFITLINCVAPVLHIDFLTAEGIEIAELFLFFTPPQRLAGKCRVR